MRQYFPEAVVVEWERHESDLSLPDPDDRHVVAAAVVGVADLIVTQNLRDFPADRLPGALRAVHPDAFLLDLLDANPAIVLACLRAQSADTGRYGKAPLPPEYILRSLELAGVPAFVAEVRG